MNNDTQDELPEVSNDFKSRFTTVTPLSRYLAMLLFVMLPFFGFWLGVQYQTEKESVYIPNVEEGESNLQEKQLVEEDGLISLKIPGCEELLFEESIDYCYFDVAQSRSDINLCSHIKEKETKTQCYDYLSQTDEEKLEVYALSSIPSAISINDTKEVFFSLSYAGTVEPAVIRIEELNGDGDVLKNLGALNDNGENGDLDNNDYLYGGTFQIGPYDSERRLWYRAVLEFPTDSSKNTTSDTYIFEVTRFPTEISPSNSRKIIFDPISGGQIVSGEVLVSFADDVGPDRIREIVEEVNGNVIGVIHGLGIYQVGLVTDDVENLYSVIKTLEGYPEVEYAETNGVASVD